MSGLWLLDGAPEAMLTSIDSEAVHQQHARAQFHEAGISPNRLRLIPGRALEVLPDERELVRHRLRRRRPAAGHRERRARPASRATGRHRARAARALAQARLNPAQRDEIASAFRTLVAEVCASPAVVSVLSPIGDGLLQANKRRA